MLIWPIAETSAASTDTPWLHAMEWASRFHVLTAHFPIALLLAAALAEGWAVWRRDSTPSPTVRFCLWTGTAGALITAALGWPHAVLTGFGDIEGSSLQWHRLIGTFAALLAVATLAIGERNQKNPHLRLAFRALLFTLAILIAVTGHLGGLLTHGEDFLKW